MHEVEHGQNWGNQLKGNETNIPDMFYHVERESNSLLFAVRSVLRHAEVTGQQTDIPGTDDTTQREGRHNEK